MAVSLTKGEKVNLSKVVEKLANVTVGLGWDAAEYGDSIDCDSSVFVLKNVVGKSGMFGLFKKEEKARLANDEDIIYYGHKKHSNGCILCVLTFLQKKKSLHIVPMNMICL